MANFISNLFKAVGQIPQAIGKFTYEAGIPNEFATAYANKQEADLKQQYYALGRAKLAAELEEQELKNKINYNTVGRLLPQMEYDSKDHYIANFTNPFSQKQPTMEDKQNKMFSDILLGNKTEQTPNFVPKMDNQLSFNGYKPWTNEEIKTNVPNPNYKEPIMKIIPQTTTTQSQEYEYKDIKSFADAGNDPDLDNLDPRTAKAGSLLLDHLNSNGISAKISSGYRDVERNARVGGVSGSNHTIGGALDIIFDNPEDQAKATAIAEQSGWRVYPEGDHLHIDGFKGTLPDDNQTTTQTNTTVVEQSNEPKTIETISTKSTPQFFSNIFEKKPNIEFRPKLQEHELVNKYRPVYAWGNSFGAGEIDQMALNPQEFKVRALMKAGLMPTANEQQKYNLDVLKFKADTVDKATRLAGYIREKCLENGADEATAQSYAQQITQLSAQAGIVPPQISIPVGEGTKVIKLRSDLIEANNRNRNRDANTTINANKLALEAMRTKSTLEKNAAYISKLNTEKALAIDGFKEAQIIKHASDYREDMIKIKQKIDSAKSTTELAAAIQEADIIGAKYNPYYNVLKAQNMDLQEDLFDLNNLAGKKYEQLTGQPYNYNYK